MSSLENFVIFAMDRDFVDVLIYLKGFLIFFLCILKLKHLFLSYCCYTLLFIESILYHSLLTLLILYYQFIIIHVGWGNMFDIIQLQSNIVLIFLNYSLENIGIWWYIAHLILPVHNKSIYRFNMQNYALLPLDSYVNNQFIIGCTKI